MLKGSELLTKLEYGPAPEGSEAVYKWLDSHDRRFGYFSNGQWHQPEGREYVGSVNPCDGRELAQVVQANCDEDLEAAVSSAAEAQKTWAALPGRDRARHLYALARQLQKHHRLLAVLESLDNGKPIRETRDADVPLAVRHFYHHAGWAQLMDTELADYAPVGVVAQVIPWNFPLLMLAWKIAPALAMGNTVVLKPAPSTPLSALLFCDIVAEAGLPPGVVNILPGGNDLGQALISHVRVQKVAFTGSTGVGRILRQATAGSGKKLSLELGGKSPFVVFDTADLDAVVEGVVDAIWFNQGQVCCAGSRLLVQESVYPTLLRKLKVRMTHLRVGDALDKGMDLGAINSQRQFDTIQRYIELARESGADVYQATQNALPTGAGGWYMPPTLISNIDPSHPCVCEEIFGPVMTAMSFRSPAEAVELANNTPYGLAASVWAEDVGTCLDMAFRIKAGVIWVNSHNLFDAAAGFGGYKESGFGRESGKEGLLEYLRPKWVSPQSEALHFSEQELSSPWGASIPPGPFKANSSSSSSNGHFSRRETERINRTTKLYIGGKQVRPDGAYSRVLLSPVDGQVLGEVGESNRKDVREAVEAARKAAPGWGARAAYNRSQILYYIAENLDARFAEFALRIARSTGVELAAAEAEVRASIDRLFHWAAWADKYGGTVQETPLYGATVAIHEPVGVVGVLCPEERPLLGFVSLVAAAVVRANAVVVVPSEAYPLPATDLYQVLETSDLPDGVINIVTGDRELLAKTLAEHMNVDAVWYFGSALGSRHVEHASASNLKRTWVNYGKSRDWYHPKEGAGPEFLYHSTQVKNIWIPAGI